ncbi:MAG: FecR domain-containing protein [Acidobacteriota bacterium]|nr:FecR domain-containing protein [Acidobacteriota bacterium]
MSNHHGLSEQRLDELLDQGIEALRDERLGSAELEQAAARVRRRLSRELDRELAARQPGGVAHAEDASEDAVALSGCDDFQAFIPDYLHGDLSPSRALLLEDHARGCIPCRRALQAARSRALGEGEAAEPQPAKRSESRSPWLRWAAMVAVTVGLGWALWAVLGIVPLPWGEPAVVAQLDGQLFQLTRDGYLPVSTGQEVPYGTVLRTARDTEAVLRLADGSELELAPRSEIQVQRRRAGTTVRLSRGNVIVEAAPQGSGNLFVATDDCLVSVTGTIFAVNHGTKGSRVSVVEGAVKVGYGARNAVLTAGDQIATHPSLAPVPVADEVAWSRNVDEYLALLRELKDLGREIDDALPRRGLRHASAFLDRVPGDTVVYAGLPNVGGDLQQAYQIIEQRVATSPALARWWQQSLGEDHEELAEGLQRLADVSEQLGDEVVVAVTAVPGDGTGEDDSPRMLILAEALDPQALLSIFEAEILQAQDSAPGSEIPVVLVEDPAALPADEAERLLVWVHDGLLAVASHRDLLLDLQDGASAFSGTQLHQTLSQVYADGADWLVAADMGVLIQRTDAEDQPALASAGILDVETLVLERRRELNDHMRHRAVLSFGGPRQGLASWLAAPAPMASLDFVSPDAHLASAALVKNPAAMLEDVSRMLGAQGIDLMEQLQNLERSHGIDVMADLAEPLGGEFAFALDGPLLPEPSWKLVLEVYDAARLQTTLERLVAEARGIGSVNGEPMIALTLDQETVGGQVYYRLHGTAGATGGSDPLDLHYAYVDGYMVAAPSRPLIEHAVGYRDSGYTLASSPRFSNLLPSDGHANFSALTYQNLQPVLGPLAQLWNGGTENLSPEQRQTLEELVADTPATLACAYGEEDRIVLVSDTEGDYLSSLLGAAGALGLDLFAADAAAQSAPTGTAAASAAASGPHA